MSSQRKEKNVTDMTFAQLGLHSSILRALTTQGYEKPTPIQAQAIPHVMAKRDLLGIAQTGTGKTAAFALPILNHLAANPMRAPRGGCRALVLSPTRELAAQIADNARAYARHLNLRVAVIYGGVGFGGQIKQLQQGIDLLVATPGRLLDHVSQQTARLDQVEIFVLDEADQMLDLGFILPIRKIVAMLPRKRQSLFFSATMPKAISSLASDLLTDPAEVAVTPAAKTADKVAQRVIFVEGDAKRAALVKLLADPAMTRVLAFSRTKHGADKIARHLEISGINAAAIHGNKSQSQREKALGGFRAGQVRVLVATDIAARGIDVDKVTHVVNVDLPNVAESYVHRIGRTARAGASGEAISFCDNSERGYLKDIERLIKIRIPSEDQRTHRNASAEVTQIERPAGQQPRNKRRRRFRPTRAAA